MEQFSSNPLKIWPKGLSQELNVSCFFVAHFHSASSVMLTITGCSFYKVYLNGRFLSFGPARAAHSQFRVDSLPLEALLEQNVLVIEASGYACRSFYALNQPSFIQAEIVGKDLLMKTGQDFECYLSPWRYQRVSRFSYQRAFSESYHLDAPSDEFFMTGKASWNQTPVEVISYGETLARNVHFPALSAVPFVHKESGIVRVDPSKNLYRDRYMSFSTLKIFPMDQWEVNPNDTVSRFSYCPGEMKQTLRGMEYSAYKGVYSLTGFIDLHVRVLSPATLYVVFDEIPTNASGFSLTFFRNTTQNILSYELGVGDFHLQSFEPYTAQYIQVIVASGVVDQVTTGITRFENPDADRLSFACEDSKLNAIVEAARHTFAQNAVDILTDCPSRERAGWLCDAYFSGKAERLFTGHNRVEKNFLVNYINAPQLPNLPKGMLPMCYPADFEDGTFIPNWALWFIIELEDYFRRTQDGALIQSAKEKVFSVLDYFKAFLNGDGLLEDLKGWIFVEWSKANDADFVSGVNYPSNMLYAFALECAGRLYGKEEFLTQCKKIKQTIREQSYNGVFFEDNKIRQDGRLVSLGHMSETCQYYAFYFGVATVEEDPVLFDRMLSLFGPKRDAKKMFPEVAPSNVFIGDYLRLDFLRRCGHLEQVASETVDYFFAMAERTGTLWEHDSPYASLNHGFASYIANMIVECVTGIHEIDGKKKTITLLKPAFTLDYSLVLPVGEASLTFKRYQGIETITVPEGFSIARR